MIARQKISQRQVFYFLFSTAAGTIAYLHSVVIALAGRGAWIAEMVGIWSLLPLALWTLYLGRMAPGRTIMEILELVAGKIIGRAVGALYVLVSIAVTGLVLRLITSIVGVFLLPDTPGLVITLSLLALTTLIAAEGIEVQGRMGEILVVILLGIFFVAVNLAFTTQFRLDYFFPLFDRGAGQFAQSAYLSAGLAAEANLFLLVMVAAFPQPADAYWAVARSFLWDGLLLGLAAMSIIGVFGAEEAARVAFGGVNMALDIQLGFLQGLEIFFIMVYILVGILTVIAHTYSAWMTAASICNNWRPHMLLAGTAVITALLTTRLVSYNEACFFSVLLARYVILPLIALILLLTSIGVLLRGEGLLRGEAI